jgi:RNA recognition motif-containing protein
MKVREGRIKRFATLDYPTPEAARAAVRALQSTTMPRGKKLKVEISKNTPVSRSLSADTAM